MNQDKGDTGLLTQFGNLFRCAVGNGNHHNTVDTGSDQILCLCNLKINVGPANLPLHFNQLLCCIIHGTVNHAAQRIVLTPDDHTELQRILFVASLAVVVCLSRYIGSLCVCCFNTLRATAHHSGQQHQQYQKQANHFFHRFSSL